MNTIIKRMLAFILSFALIFATTARANAVTSVGGWSATDSLIAGANTTINAAKTKAGKALKSSITVAASASKVGKYLIKGGGQAALAYAVIEILGEGIDWVLDPANNAIKYKDATASGGVKDYAGNPAPVGTYWVTNGFCQVASYSPAAACAVFPFNGVIVDKGGYYICLSNRIEYRVNLQECSPPVAGGGGATDADADGYKYIPIDTVAAKVISNAEAGHGPSQEAVKAAALEGFAAGEHDAALDAAAVPDTGVENPPDTENPPKDPAEPFDPAGIISAINALKALLAGILSSITGLSDWFQSEPPPEPKPEDTELDILIPDVVPVDTDINFGGSCPANFEFNGSIFGNPINIVLLDTSKFCGFLSTFVKFPVYAASSLFALYILGGRKDG